MSPNNRSKASLDASPTDSIDLKFTVKLDIQQKK